jgi:hypothetical protein
MAFCYTSIADGEIRLLQRNRQSSPKELSYTLHVVKHDAAPQYAAISYMWGLPPDDKLIYINNLKAYVRQNCLDALQKVHQHDEYEFIWLDFICIDQTNLEEKSRQVHKMGNIFRKADAVLACIGLGDSKVSLELLESAVSTVKGIRAPDNYPWPDALPEKRFREVFEALNLMAALPYWDRLWIIQEIHLARTVKLYIGPSSLEWRRIVALHVAIQTTAGLASVLDKRLRSGGFSSLVEGEYYYKAKRYSIDVALENFTKAECSLAHDRIYGLRELIEWPSSMGAIVPDYTIDPFELALRAMQWLMRQQYEKSGLYSGASLHFVAALLRGLKIDSSNAVLAKKLHDLHQTAPSEVTALTEVLGHHRDWHSMPDKCLEHNLLSLYANDLFTLSSDERGRLNTSFRSWGEGRWTVLTRLAFEATWLHRVSGQQDTFFDTTSTVVFRRGNRRLAVAPCSKW